ncbi:MAG: efflux RND transporter periplasmic adaptor subunit [Candidatus Solibacter usitatus]|nr:efflux RND transporter periplasmic adaptor subunit [Candidatus Solibacter usitatus]
MREIQSIRTRPEVAGTGAVAVLLAAVLLAGCNKAASADKEAAKERPASNPMEIRATPALMERVKVGEAGWAEVGGTLEVAARVEVDESRVARVGAPVMGRITELDVHEGQQVVRGQVLAVLNSTGLSDAQLGLLKAMAQQQLAQRAVERAEQLLQAGVIGSAELRRREAELAQTAADVAASRDQLRILGMPPDALENLEKTRTINSLLRVTSHMDGTVMARKVAPGQVIQAADTLAEIADLTQLWLVADVPEQHAGTLSAGQTVQAEIAALAGVPIKGKLAFVSATVNPETRTVRVRMDLPNPQRRYKPAMLATMSIADRAQRKRVIPAAAVVRDGDKEHVYVQSSPEVFTLRPVTLGDEFDGRRVLVDGLRAGEKIVVDGAFHLNNERIRLSVQGA